MITRVSTNEDSRDLSAVVDSVNMILVTEGVDVVFNGGSGLFGCGSIDGVGERSKSVNGSTINSMGVISVTVV